MAILRSFAVTGPSSRGGRVPTDAKPGQDAGRLAQDGAQFLRCFYWHAT